MISSLIQISVHLLLAVGSVSGFRQPPRKGVYGSTPPKFNESTPIPNHYIVQYRDTIAAGDRHRHEADIHTSASKSGLYRGVMKKINIGPFSGYQVELDAEDVKLLNATGLVCPPPPFLPCIATPTLTGFPPQVKSIVPDARIHILSPLHRHEVRDIQQLTNIRTVQTATW